MATTVILATDGSELALSAIRQGLALLSPADRTVLVTVAADPDPTLVTGTGFAGGVMVPEELDRLIRDARLAADETLERTAAELGLEGHEALVLQGDPGYEICELAASLPASVVVMGTHGRRGLRRAVMGSTSDHVVRHAVCPVLVQGAG